MKTFKLFISIRKLELKLRLSNKFDFFIFILSDFFTQLLTFIFIHTLFENIPNLNGWSYEQILLIFGLYQFSYGLFGFLFWPLYDFSYILVSGNLDSILVKPINELLQLYGKGIGDVGGVFIGLVIIIRFINISQISIIRLLLIIIPMTFMNILIFVCLFTIVASLSFWFENISNSLIRIIQSLTIYSKYPLNIFNKFIKIIFTFIIPFGFMGYYPVAILYGKEQLYYICIEVLVCLFLVLFTKFIWKKGIKKYSGVNS